MNDKDPKAFEVLYAKYYSRLRLYIRRRIASTADSEDLTQSVFVRLWESHARYQNGASVEAYFSAVASNTVAQFVRKRKRQHQQLHLNLTAREEHPLSTEEKEMAEKMREGAWRLKANVVVRVEEDGVILFDPDTDAISVANPIGGALVQWRPERICFDEWCEALCKHYREEVNLPQIQADLKKFLGAISHYVEPCDVTSN